MTRPLLLRGIRPYGAGEPVDLLVRDGVIAELGAGLDATGAEVLDGGGLVALPGLVDLHAHLREPGREDAETIATASAAAALGGYTAVFAMANTDPVADTAVVVEHVYRRGREVGLVDVHPVGAVTVGLLGERLAELTDALHRQPGPSQQRYPVPTLVIHDRWLNLCCSKVKSKNGVATDYLWSGTPSDLPPSQDQDSCNISSQAGDEALCRSAVRRRTPKLSTDLPGPGAVSCPSSS